MKPTDHGSSDWLTVFGIEEFVLPFRAYIINCFYIAIHATLCKDIRNV
jgi:hypothetical protein